MKRVMRRTLAAALTVFLTLTVLTTGALAAEADTGTAAGDAVQAVAGTGGREYDTLQAAVDAVENGGTVEVLAATAEDVVVKRAVSFTLKDGEGLFTGTVSAGEEFTMVKDDAGTYTFTKKPDDSAGGFVTRYRVEAQFADNGMIKADVDSARAGDTVTVTVSPDSGYALEALTAIGAETGEVELRDNGDGTYSFVMPESRVELTAQFVKLEIPFTDVPVDAWYRESLWYVYHHDLFTGKSAASFAPDATATRAEVVTVLWRMDDRLQANLLLMYSDVPEEQWYTEAVRWATATTVAGGYGGGRFGPSDSVTREQFAVMLYRFAKYKGLDVTAGETALDEFTDTASVSSWAVDAMTWAVDKGIINGTGGRLDPQGSAVRSQLAAMIHRFAKLG